MERLKGLLLHTGVICSCVCIIAKVLDWYNPFMDFTGHVWYMQTVLYFAVILLALLKSQKDFCDCKKEYEWRMAKCGNQTEKIQRAKKT